MSELQLGPWPLGMDMISAETRLPRDERGRVTAVRDAVNVDIDDDGLVYRRGEFELVSAEAWHSLRDTALGAYAVVNGYLSRVEADGSHTPIVQLAYNAPVDYAVVNDRLCYSNLGVIGYVRGSQYRPVAAATPAPPAIYLESFGGLTAGRYGICLVSLEFGEESGASEAVFVDVPEGGGIRIGMPNPNGIRVYRTPPNGDVFYRVDDLAPSITNYVLGVATPGTMVHTRHLEPMIPGSMLRYWRGRLLTVRGRNLYYSHPMSNLYDPRDGFVQRPAKIRFIEPVEDGVWVGTAYGVEFLRGLDPDSWVIEQKGAAPPVAGSSRLIRSGIGDAELSGGNHFAVWLAENGYVIGTSGGQLIEPQAKRIRLTATSGATAVHERRIITVVR